MSEMEKDARDLLRRVLLTVSLGSLWLLVNSTFGIMFGWLFFEGNPKPGNLVFYGWFVFSLVALIRFYIKIWKKHL